MNFENEPGVHKLSDLDVTLRRSIFMHIVVMSDPKMTIDHLFKPKFQVIGAFSSTWSSMTATY